MVQMRDLHVEHNLLTSFAGLGDQPHLKHIFLQGNDVSAIGVPWLLVAEGYRCDYPPRVAAQCDTVYAQLAVRLLDATLAVARCSAAQRRPRRPRLASVYTAGDSWVLTSSPGQQAVRLASVRRLVGRPVGSRCAQPCY